METKQLIIIGVLVVIICVLVGALFGTLTNSVNYERIEIVPNGTSIEVPTNDAKYLGDKEGVKFWNWSNGALVTYNSQEGSNAFELSGALGFFAIKELVRSGASENIDGFTVYQLNGQQLVNTNVSAKGDVFYCIHLVNETTHDNIVICCEDKDIALHMAKSIEYKIPNSSNNATANTTSSGNSSGLVPVTMDDGSVIYCHVGEYIEKQDGTYRVNADGSVTKVADSSDSQIDDNDNEDYDYDDDYSSGSSSGSGSSDSGSSSGSSSGGSGSSGGGSDSGSSGDVESTTE